MINPFDGSLQINISLEKIIAEELKKKKNGIFRINFLVENGEIKRAISLQWSEEGKNED